VFHCLTYGHACCSASQCTSGCQPLIHNVLKRDFDGVVSVSASAFAAVVAFQSIVEFSDVDNNGVFDPSVDSILSSYDFLSPSCEPLLWGPMNAYKKEGADGTTEYALNITTQDGVFSVEYAVSNAVRLHPMFSSVLCHFFFF